MPALVQTPLSAPGDLDYAWILAVLAARERLTDRWAVAVVVGSLDQESRQPLGLESLPVADLDVGCRRHATRRPVPAYLCARCRPV